MTLRLPSMISRASFRVAFVAGAGLTAGAGLMAGGCKPDLHALLFGPSSLISETQPAPRFTPAPLASPQPRVEPTPAPGPTPCDAEGCPELPDDTSPVASVGALVFFLECNGVPIAGSKYAAEAPVGCRIHFDCTPKDATNAPTRAKGEPYWTFTPASIISGGNPTVYSPAVLAVSPGMLEAYAVIDGIASNTVAIRLTGAR